MAKCSPFSYASSNFTCDGASSFISSVQAFQLNTLDFDSKTERNLFFRKDMQLINKGKFDEATWAQFKRILSYPLQMGHQGTAKHK